MTISKFTLIHMNNIDISNHKVSPREEDSVEFQASLVHQNDEDSDSEFDDFAEDSGWFATHVQESTPTKRRSSAKEINLLLKAPAVKRRSSIAKYTAPLKDTSSKQTRRSSAKLLSKSKRTTKEDFRRRVRNTVGRDSLHIHRNRLQGIKVTASKATETWNFDTFYNK